MSESEYRDAREAARARVLELESQLREKKSAATKLPTPPVVASDEKKEIRAHLAEQAKKRRWILYAAILFGVTGLRRMLYGLFPNAFYEYPHQDSGLLWLVVLCGAALVAAISRIPGRRERALEKKLHWLLQREDETDQRFRVESAPTQKRIDEENADLERLERELEETRAMAQDEKKN